MEIEVKIKSNDILDENEIRDIVENEIRKCVKECFTKNDEYGTDNIAFYIKEFYLKDELEEHKEEIKIKFKKQLDKFSFSSYDVDKNNLLSNMLIEQVKENKSTIKQKAQETINKRLDEDFMDDYTVADKIAETFKDVVIEAIANKFKG